MIESVKIISIMRLRYNSNFEFFSDDIREIREKRMQSKCRFRFRIQRIVYKSVAKA